jgi:Carbohydrate-selective porin, OprB family/S-layer homology domain
VSMKSLLILGGALALSSFATAALAAETTDSLTTAATPSVQPAVAPFSTFQVIQADEQEQSQVTAVSQLSDVQPTDWAFQALQSLVERYGCIAGYPDGTFRGNRASTRYELAAALNACLDQISDRFATKEDLATVKALQEEFKTELATLKGRVDGLEARTKTLEAQQFSTTTKLSGEAIFSGVQSNNTSPQPSGLNGTGILGPTGDNFTFNYRATLSLLTSFTGKDLLITSLQQGTFANPSFVNGVDPNGRPTAQFGTSFGGLAPGFNQSSSDNIGLYYLGYRFPVLKDKGTVYITAKGGELSDFTDTLNPNFDSDGQGALSGFGIRNPIYRPLSGRTSRFNGGTNQDTSGTGFGLNYNISDKFNLAVGYLAPAFSAAQSTNVSPGVSGSGLFGGDYSAIAQLTYKPTKDLGFGLTYVRAYNTGLLPIVNFGGGSGTFRANIPFFLTPTSSHSAGLEFSWKATPKFALSGWAGGTFARAEADGLTITNDGTILGFAPKGSDATIVNFALAASFPDLFAPGNMGGIIVGMEPQLVSSSVPNSTDKDMNFHIEALYRFKVNDNISITPGVIAIINPEGNSSNDPIVVGTIRTTFTF